MLQLQRADIMNGGKSMIAKFVAAASLLAMTPAVDAAVLFSISDTMDPSWGSYYFFVPVFTYDIPFTVAFELSRSLVSGEYLDMVLEQSTVLRLFKDGNGIEYDYYVFLYSNVFTLVSQGSVPSSNYYSYNSWWDNDWDGPHFYEEMSWVTLRGIWLDNAIYTPFDWTITISDAIPEPASWGLMIAGFGLVGLATRRKLAAATA